MYKTSKYTPTDKMSYLICDNYTLLQVMRVWRQDSTGGVP